MAVGGGGEVGERSILSEHVKSLIRLGENLSITTICCGLFITTYNKKMYEQMGSTMNGRFEVVVFGQ